jgi:(4S)-4-hydroxy-5-phosphonooxypentane-2,3-dione isomerase
MPKVSFLAKLKVKEGKGDELIAAFEPLFEQVAKEPGTLLYAMNRAKDNPDDALAAHGSSDAMANAGPAFAPLIDDSELIIGEPVRAKGLPG